MARKTIVQWIAEAGNDPDKAGKLIRLVLVIKQGINDEEVHTCKLDNGRQWTAEDLGKMFDGKAVTRASNVPGTHTFNLRAFYNDDPSTHQAQYVFLKQGGDEAFQTGLATEAPTAEGRLQQRMRHEEMGMSQIFRRQQQMDEFTMSTIRELGSQLLNMRHEVAEAYGIARQASLAMHTELHKLRMAELEYERSSDERRKMLGMVPSLVNTVTGKEVFPQEAEDSSLIESLAENISEDQFRMFLNFVPQTLVGPLSARFERVMKQKREAKERAKEMAKALSVDPIADATGDVFGSNGKKLTEGGE